MQTSFYTSGLSLDSPDLIHRSTQQGKLKIVEQFYHALESGPHSSYLVLWSAKDAAKLFENLPCMACTDTEQEWFVHHRKNEPCPLLNF